MTLRINFTFYANSTVYEDELDVHVRTRCNARPTSPPPYYKFNCNVTLSLSPEEIAFQKQQFYHSHFKTISKQPWLLNVRLDEIPKKELDSLFNKIRTIYSTIVERIEMKVLDHEAVVSKREGITFTKHLDQQVGMVGSYSRTRNLFLVSEMD